MTITINGRDYDPDDKVEWEDAAAEDGFYYERAQHLGLPRPTAILFDKDAAGYLEAMGQYHARFKDAEARPR